MSIKRAPAMSRDPAVIRLSVANDERLSFIALGVLAYVLSRPDGWNLTVVELARRSIGSARPLGRGVIYSVLNELIEAGYVYRHRLASGGVEYTVYDTRLRLVHGAAEGIE